MFRFSRNTLSGSYRRFSSLTSFTTSRTTVDPRQEWNQIFEECWRQMKYFFYASSACVYPIGVQETESHTPMLSETEIVPANADQMYGWEKLMSEMFCEEYWHERGLKTFIARFHNVYGPHGT